MIPFFLSLEHKYIQFIYGVLFFLFLFCFDVSLKELEPFCLCLFFFFNIFIPKSIGLKVLHGLVSLFFPLTAVFKPQVVLFFLFFFFVDFPFKNIISSLFLLC